MGTLEINRIVKQLSTDSAAERVVEFEELLLVECDCG